jgi:hypothetical protein
VKLLRCLLVVLCLLVSAPVFAQAGEGEGEAAAAEDAAESRATAFQAVEGPQQEQVPGGGLLIGAYAFVLVLLVGYVGRLASLQRKTTREIERLTRAIEHGKRA